LPCKEENIGEKNSILNYMPRPIEIPEKSGKIEKCTRTFQQTIK
jgi:hypothetical protein